MYNHRRTLRRVGVVTTTRSSSSISDVYPRKMYDFWEIHSVWCNAKYNGKRKEAFPSDTQPKWFPYKKAISRIDFPLVRRFVVARHRAYNASPAAYIAKHFATVCDQAADYLPPPRTLSRSVWQKPAPGVVAGIVILRRHNLLPDHKGNKT